MIYSYCDATIQKGETYIKVYGEETRYCKDCYEESITTACMVGGEFVGTDDDIEEYDYSETE